MSDLCPTCDKPTALHTSRERRACRGAYMLTAPHDTTPMPPANPPPPRPVRDRQSGTMRRPASTPTERQRASRVNYDETAGLWRAQPVATTLGLSSAEVYRIFDHGWAVDYRPWAGPGSPHWFDRPGVIIAGIWAQEHRDVRPGGGGGDARVSERYERIAAALRAHPRAEFVVLPAGRLPIGTDDPAEVVAALATGEPLELSMVVPTRAIVDRINGALRHQDLLPAST